MALFAAALLGTANARALAAEGPASVDQGANDKRLAGWKTPPGFKAEVLAERPAVAAPVALAFADDGTPWVLEWDARPGDEPREAVATLKYKDGTSRQVAVRRKKHKDRVKVLSSSKNDGVFDTARVVLEDEFPCGILLHDGWLYLAGQGTVRRYKPSKPGGAYDVKQVVARGFAGWTHPAGCLTLGDDGWLYVAAGEGDHWVEGSDGSRAAVRRSGAVFRCRPDGSKVEVFALGLCNPGGGAFDLGGNLFLADSLPQEKGLFAGGRLLHLAEGADFGWRLAVGARSGQADPARAGVRGERPGKMPPLVRTPRTDPAGLFVYNDTRLPEEYRGLLLHPDASRGRVQAYRVEPAGATFKAVSSFPLLQARKGDTFRPTQVVGGPDGALYVVDRGGRILRMRWSGVEGQPALPLRKADAWAKVTQLGDDDLVKALGGEEASDRARARAELVRRGEKNRKALLKLLKDDATPLVAKITVVGALRGMFDADVQAGFAKALAEGDGELQRVAAGALGECAARGDRKAQNALLVALAIEDFAVRRAVALAMGRLAGPGAADNLATALSFDESKDLFLRDGLLRALEELGKPGIDALLALADSGVQKDTDRVVEAFLGLRSPAAFAALPRLLGHRHVGSTQRAELLRSATNYQPAAWAAAPLSLEGLAAAVGRRPETAEVKVALLEALAAAGAARGPKSSAWVVSRLEDGSAEVRLAALAAAAVLRPAAAGPVLQKRLAALKDDGPELRATVRALAATPEGARLVGKRLLDGKLPAGLRAEVIAGLRRHAAKDAAAARMLAEVMK
jgi:putative membrane-bound dehydrogenase-like protein